MLSQTERNLSRMALGKTKARKIMLREASTNYMNKKSGVLKKRSIRVSFKTRF